MIGIKNIRNQKISVFNLTRAFFYCFPLSFIVGNFAITLNLLLFIIFSLILIKREKLDLRFNSSIWILIVFFSYLCISTTIQFQLPGLLNEKMQLWSLEENPIFKSVLLIRYPILIFVVDTLFFNKILSLKKFLLSTFICTSFVSFDVIFQYFVGFDLFGYKSFGDRNPGPFGDEWISGSYLQKFSFFSIFYVYEISKNKNFGNLLTVLTIVLHSTAILLAGNRMPFLLYFFGCGLIILLISNIRLIFFSSLLIFSVVIFTIFSNDRELKKTYFHLFDQVNIFKLININKTQDNLEIATKPELGDLYFNPQSLATKFLYTSGHANIYRTSMVMWKEQPLFGFGLKSFRIKCHEVDHKGGRLFTIDVMPYNDIGFSCANHSHNYYIELLAETGIIGTLLIIIFFLILLKDSFYYLGKYKRQINSEAFLLIPVVVAVFLEIWPIKSTGSFFTVWSATFLWLSVSLLMLIKTKKFV